jgi:flagellar secretion chaperone FliS
MMYAQKSASGSGASAYARMGLETSVMSASPHQLLMLLFDGAKTAISMARHHMVHSEIAAKGKAISKAINIIDSGIRLSFDAEGGDAAGAELVANMSALFDYITERLLYANLRNDPALLDEADRLLDSLSSAWREVDPNKPGFVSGASAALAPASFSIGA